jgi:hypothetical protein
MSIIVFPVPWRFFLLLKLLTRTCPWTNFPVDVGTTKTPYGLTSPLAGTVDAIKLVALKFPVNEPPPANATMDNNTRTEPNSKGRWRKLDIVYLLLITATMQRNVLRRSELSGQVRH